MNDLWAQDSFDYNRIPFFQITTDQGLSQSNVNSILQDSLGYLWVGTDNGLNRFDGEEFTIYGDAEGDPSLLESSRIICLFEDDQRNLWIGTYGNGLHVLNRKNDTFTTHFTDPNDDRSISSGSITDIKQDQYGDIWVATYGGLNFRRKNTTSFEYLGGGPEDGPSSDIIYTLYVIDDLLYVGHSMGLSVCHIPSQKFSHFIHDPDEPGSISEGQVVSIESKNSNELWVGTDVGGLNVLNLTSKQFNHYVNQPNQKNSLPSNAINLIHKNWEGKDWISTENNGISIFEKDRFFRIKPTNLRTFNDASVQSIYEGSNKVWIGTYGEGIYQFNKTGVNFLHYINFHPYISETEDNSIHCFVEDSRGHIWIGTDGSGLFDFDPQTSEFVHYRHEEGNRNSISSDVVKSIFIDDRENLYIGTYLGGMDYIDRKSGRISHFNTENSPGLTNNNVWTISPAENNNLWIGTLNGLHYFNSDERTFERMEVDLADPLAYPSSYTAASKKLVNGDLWFATPVGMVKYMPDQKNFKRYNPTNSGILAGAINYIEEIGDGDFFAVFDRGISRYSRQSDSFNNLEMPESFNTQIRTALFDDDGFLWVSTLEGIFKLDQAGTIIKQFNISDGLQGNEFNYGAALKASNNTFYFGGLKGFNTFKPEQVIVEETPLSMVINELFIFNEFVPTGSLPGYPVTLNYLDDLRLDYNQNFISINYSAIDFSFPRSIEYSYMMEGFDPDWNYVGETNMATYTNLSPGSYTFKVRAKRKSGEWIGEAKTLNIWVSAPFWQTNWFYLSMAASFLFFFTFVFRWRTNTLRLKSEKLESHVDERTEELQKEINNRKKTENELRKTVNELRHTQHQLVMKEKMASVGVLTAGIAHELNNPLNFIAGGLNILKNEFDREELSMKELENKMADDDDMRIVYAVRLISEGFERSHLVVKSLTSLSNKEQPILMLTDLPEMISYILEKIEEDISEITIEQQFELKTIVVLPDRLQQVLTNVLENAIYATSRPNHKHPKKITIQTWKAVENDVDKCVISIANTGQQIKQDIITRIFDPFFSTKETGAGNGLGLSTAYSFMEQQGGSIEAKNVKDGVSFLIKVPIREKPKN